MNLKEIDIDIRIKGTVTVLSQDGISSGRVAVPMAYSSFKL